MTFNWRRSPLRRASTRTLLLGSIALNIILLLYGYHPSSHGEDNTLELDLKEQHDIPKETAVSRQRSVPTAPLSARRSPASCSMCNVTPKLCDEIGKGKMDRAVSYSGTNDRLRRFLAKTQAGEPFTMAVIGGSVSRGFGIDFGNSRDPPYEPGFRPRCMHRIIFEHFHSLSPLSIGDAVPFNLTSPRGSVGSLSGKNAVVGEVGKKDGKNSLINAARGATGSNYFAYCWEEHMPRDVDVFIVELAINDPLLVESAQSYELLIRSLLELPHNPAVIYIDVFALFDEQIATGGDVHKGVNQYYDVPSISLRNPFLPDVVGGVEGLDKLLRRDHGPVGLVEGIDLRHISNYGHRMMGELVNAYVNMQLCEMELESPATFARIDEMYPISEVPKMRLQLPYHSNNTVPPLNPQCFTFDSKNKLKPIEQKGWKIWNYKEKYYWLSIEPGSTISFAFHTIIGEVHLHYLRSRTFGLGNARCWVDDDKESGKTIIGYWDKLPNTSEMARIQQGLEPGDHVLNCELLKSTDDPSGKHEFRIISVTAV